MGIIEDGILQGYSVGDGSSHQILEILLPEKLKRERPPAEFVGEFKPENGKQCMPEKSLKFDTIWNSVYFFTVNSASPSFCMGLMLLVSILINVTQAMELILW